MLQCESEENTLIIIIMLDKLKPVPSENNWRFFPFIKNVIHRHIKPLYSKKYYTIMMGNK